jgi:hypothetical protein
MEKVKLVFDDEHYFGHCPFPEHANYCLNIGRCHWMVCDTCKIKWMIGENLFSSWRDENEGIWKANAERIRGYREVVA